MLRIDIAGLDRAAALAGHVRRRLAAALERLTVRPVRALVAFGDDNGPGAAGSGAVR